MRWEGREESSNVEDRRSFPVKTGAAVGGAGLVVVIIALLLGVDPQQLLQQFQQEAPNQAQQGQHERPSNPDEERMAKFTKVILHDTEVVWDDLFRQMGKQYRKPKLILFSGKVESACGLADTAVGPFYCPGDAQVYIDLDFYRDMERKLNAPGEFARAYVVAHEVGHHVQHLLGYGQRVDEVRHRFGPKHPEAMHMSVRLELQADYFAGVWAHHGQKRFDFLEPGDVESALHAAFEIGDDRLQKKARGYVVPDAFTHGTSKQRMRWFNNGLKTGSVPRAEALFDLPYDQL
jgi:predicted metalloprotease